MNSSLALASDFIERAANPAFGLDVNEEYTLRWVVMRQTADPLPNLQIDRLGPEDIEVLSPDAWFWLGSSLTENDPELPIVLVDALFQATADEIYRLKVADMSLRHPGLSKRYAVTHRALGEMPSSWAKGRLQRLVSDDDAGARGLTEMASILLQVANKPSLRLLGALRRERKNLVDGVLESFQGEGADVTGLIQRLGLEE